MLILLCQVRPESRVGLRAVNTPRCVWTHDCDWLNLLLLFGDAVLIALRFYARGRKARARNFAQISTLFSIRTRRDTRRL